MARSPPAASAARLGDAYPVLGCQQQRGTVTLCPLPRPWRIPRNVARVLLCRHGAAKADVPPLNKAAEHSRCRTYCLFLGVGRTRPAANIIYGFDSLTDSDVAATIYRVVHSFLVASTILRGTSIIPWPSSKHSIIRSAQRAVRQWAQRSQRIGSRTLSVLCVSFQGCAPACRSLRIYLASHYFCAYHCLLL